MTEVRFQAFQLPALPELAVEIGTAVGTTGSRPATCPRTRFPIPIPTPIATSKSNAPTTSNWENAPRGPI
jgi:hypothetical protein